MSKRRVKPGEADWTGIVTDDGQLITPLRRDRELFPRDPYVVVWIVCTHDRERYPHPDPRRDRMERFSAAKVWPDYRGRFEFEQGSRYPRVAARRGTAPRWELRCPRCGRTPRLTNKTLWRELARVAVEGGRRLDISQLPY